MVAFLFFRAATAAVVTWLRRTRAAAYRRHGLLEPRKPWQIAVYAKIPLVNLVGAPFLVRELLEQRDDLDRPAAGQILRRTAIAWIVVNVAAVAALCTRFIASRSDSLQTGADGLWLTIISTALSAGFVWFVLPGLVHVFDDTPTSRRRLADGSRWRDNDNHAATSMRPQTRTACRSTLRSGGADERG